MKTNNVNNIINSLSSAYGSTFMTEWTGSINDYANYTSSTYNITSTDSSGYNTLLNYNFKYRTTLTPQKVLKINLVPITEERLEDYIQDNYDRYNIKEYGSYIYQVIQEKAYDIASEVVEEAKDDYIIDDEEKIIDVILENIDFDSLYELVENILHAPITMEDKLAEVGMSIADFL